MSAKKRSDATGEARHSAAEVERLAKELVGVFNDAPYMRLDSAWERVASHALDREAPLLAALERLACLGNGSFPGNSEGNVIAQAALAAHRSAREPEPTLAEAARAVIEAYDTGGELSGRRRTIDALDAALARERTR